MKSFNDCYKLVSTLVLILSTLSINICNGEEKVAFKRNYETAINSSYDTAQQYIAITVVNDETGIEKAVCVPSGSLMAALSLENNIQISDRKIKSLALDNQDRTYHFSKPEALKHFEVFYTANDLEMFKNKLGDFTNQELEVGFGVGQGYYKAQNTLKLHDLYKIYPYKQYTAYRDAIAFVLVSRNMSPILNFSTGGIYIESDD